MDIFTTALAKIRANPIRPDKLRVKALRKESATNELTDDINHLEDHQLYFIDEKTHQQNKGKQQQTKPQQTEEGVKASEDVILHKQDILHPQPAKDNDDDEIEHLDIFI
ncbi:hypothetical protein tinsulaeT_04180 [Thalassotalea insulae]|uniref:DUF3306 domain-containing protein n=1 Tax=Thalassotalea insulae TaxID=2056778 RepID=A0ABQ6GM45_9GAMM|nr:hypothetical protein [Thalassotalea insulae]GLX77078.1 hypothetical protein tinsulaeT_04180 [Thalassotalea insulae]